MEIKLTSVGMNCLSDLFALCSSNLRTPVRVLLPDGSLFGTVEAYTVPYSTNEYISTKTCYKFNGKRISFDKLWKKLTDAR